MFEVAGVDRMSPSKAWKLHRQVGGIEETAFQRYYLEAEHAYVIRVRNVQPFHTPLLLTDLDENLRPPQSYLYLRDDALELARLLAVNSRPHGQIVQRRLTGLASRMLAPAAR